MSGTGKRAGFLPGQGLTTRERDAERVVVTFPRCTPSLLKAGETGRDERGNPCVGLGDGKYVVILTDYGAESSARDVIRREIRGGSGDGDARAHDRQHDLRSAADHTNFGVTGSRTDGLTTDKGIVTALGTSSALPAPDAAGQIIFATGAGTWDWYAPVFDNNGDLVSQDGEMVVQ